MLFSLYMIVKVGNANIKNMTNQGFNMTNELTAQQTENLENY